jgi:hypothetical protein
MVRPAGSRLLTAAQVAQRFGVTRGWVYANADELGARRLGHGSKPRLRFDAEEVAAAMDCRDASGGSQAPVFRGAAENSQRSTQRLAPDHVASLPKRWRDAVAARRPERA